VRFSSWWKHGHALSSIRLTFWRPLPFVSVRTPDLSSGTRSNPVLPSQLILYRSDDFQSSIVESAPAPIMHSGGLSPLRTDKALVDLFSCPSPPYLPFSCESEAASFLHIEARAKHWFSPLFPITSCCLCLRDGLLFPPFCHLPDCRLLLVCQDSVRSGNDAPGSSSPFIPFSKPLPVTC